MADAKIEEALGRIVVLAGDFNEASHRDWVEENKDLYEHNGVVIPWTSTTMLEEDNFIDAYREIYPNPITHPGFTFPCYNADLSVERVVWAPESDERDRIDFIFYKPSASISLKDIFIVGPKQSVAYSKVIDETSKDVFQEPKGVWPTDHKAVLGEFIIKL
nr:endonuclease/exonuclease/phosphatase family protein [Flammeovirga pectinis]